MKLAKNIIRVNGWKNGKRTHADLEVPMIKADVSWWADNEQPMYFDDTIIQKCFRENLLDGVTSINAYNPVGGERITTRIW